jgi:hypothetical protein
MTPITFSCEETISATTTEIAEQMLDLTRWTQFRGFGVVPGIKSASFETRTPNVVGTRIRVMSSDDTTCVEEIVEWKPGTWIVIEMKEFSGPIAALATGITETWQFETVAHNQTKVIRTFELYQKSFITKPALYLISVALKQAIIRHLRQLKEESASVGRESNVNVSK